MHKTLLFAIGTCLSLQLGAQTASQPRMTPALSPLPMTKVAHTGAEPLRNQSVGVLRSTQFSSNGLKIGETTYDLQTNGSIQNRLLAHADGTVSAVWTRSVSYDLAASDRGTGYAYYNGTSWSGLPTARIESERGGWPSILSINGNEFNTLHNTTSSVVTLNQRPVKGTGTWSESNITAAAEDIIWNRTANGGPNNQTVHMVGVTAPVANSGTLYQGLDGALVYYRSQDAGATWDQQAVVLPGMDSSLFTGFGGDSYQIKAKGNTVVLAVFNQWDDSFIMKSTDNGDTWTKTIFVDLPFVKYEADQPGGSDINGDLIPDTISTTDNSGSVVIDDNGDAHIFYGNMRVLDADLSDGNTTYFPYTNGLVYWNENMNANDGEIIAWAQDYDGDGVAANQNEGEIARYFTSLASFPDAVIGDDGIMYVTYSGYMENLSNGSQSYRHVFLVRSPDLGCSWSGMEDLTPNDDFAECIFASIANSVSDSLRLIYQEDFEPGLAVRGDEDSYEMNHIVYVAKGLAELSPLTISSNALSGCETIDSITLTALDGGTWLWNNGATTQSITLNTAAESGDYWCTIYTNCGDTIKSDTLTVNIQPVPAQPVITKLSGTTYESSATSGNQWLVNGSEVMGATNQTFDAAAYPQTSIAVRVTNSAGCTNQSETVFVSVAELQILQGIELFPNPADAQVTIKNTDAHAAVSVSIRTITGQQVNAFNLNPNTGRTFSVSHWSKGLYMITYTTAGTAISEKLLVK